MTFLTLDQAKKLKELGFPQNTELSQVTHWTLMDDLIVPTKEAKRSKSHTPAPVAVYACPTLEELIDWLGDDFEELFHVNGCWSTNWYVEGIKNVNTIYGDSAIEAVYNLALAIKNQP